MHYLLICPENLIDQDTDQVKKSSLRLKEKEERDRI